MAEPPKSLDKLQKVCVCVCVFEVCRCWGVAVCVLECVRVFVCARSVLLLCCTPPPRPPLLCVLVCLMSCAFSFPPPQKDVVALMDDLQRSWLIPMQKAAFLCSAKCCDAKTPLPEIQTWCVELRVAVSVCGSLLQTHLHTRSPPPQTHTRPHKHTSRKPKHTSTH
jgi:hypothetical protein